MLFVVFLRFVFAGLFCFDLNRCCVCFVLLVCVPHLFSVFCFVVRLRSSFVFCFCCVDVVFRVLRFVSALSRVFACVFILCFVIVVFVLVCFRLRCASCLFCFVLVCFVSCCFVCFCVCFDWLYFSVSFVVFVFVL